MFLKQQLQLRKLGVLAAGCPPLGGHPGHASGASHALAWPPPAAASSHRYCQRHRHHSLREQAAQCPPRLGRRQHPGAAHPPGADSPAVRCHEEALVVNRPAAQQPACKTPACAAVFQLLTPSRPTHRRTSHRLVYRGTVAYTSVAPVCQYLGQKKTVTLTGTQHRPGGSVTETVQVECWRPRTANGCLECHFAGHAAQCWRCCCCLLLSAPRC